LASVLSIGFATAAHARDWVDVLSNPLVDPLLSRPPQLDLGKVLPGDQMAVQCPDGGANLRQLPDQPITLALTIDIALCNSPQSRSAWASIKVQAAQVGEARAAYLPTVNLGMSQLQDKTTYPETQFVVNTDRRSETQFATLTWRLLDFGGRDANRRSANALLESALASHDAVLQKAMLGVVAAYFDVQTAQAVKNAKDRAQELANKTLQTAQRREARGAGAQSDTLQATTALARVELDSSRAMGAYDKAVTSLVLAMGLSPAIAGRQSLTLADDLQGELGEIGKDLQAWLEIASAQHPAIVAARNQLQSAKEKLTSTRSEGLPALDFTQSLYINGRPNQGLASSQSEESIIGFNLNFPLFDGFARTYKVRGAQAQVEVKEAELQDTQNQTLSDVAKAHADATSALRSLGASKKLEASAINALESVQRRFERGVVDVLELLNVQAALADAQQERIRALADWRSARLRLVASAGKLGRAAMGK
jgi:outer membrane protein